MNKRCQAAIVKKSSRNCQQTLKTHKCVTQTLTPSKKVIVESQLGQSPLTITIESQKRAVPVASSSSGQKAEKRESTSDNSKPLQNWREIFAQQNLLHMKNEQSSKGNGNGEIKNTTKQQKSTVKHSVKSDERHLKTPVYVRDRAVQCSEIHNSNQFTEFDPVHMLFLIKQLQDLVTKKDERISEIFIKMEQMLQKTQNLETKVELTTTIPLKESGKKMRTISYNDNISSFLLEQEKLQSKILKQDEQLKEADKKYSQLALTLTQQLDEATHEKNNLISIITDLKQQIRNNGKEITDLKANWDKQTELEHKNYIENKYLRMEIDKLSELSSFKDKQIINYQNTVKELQSHIAKLKTIDEICMKEGSTSPQMSLIDTGYAHSSPTSSFSENSNKSWRLSDISSVPEQHALNKNAPIKDFEFVSLFDEESSHTIISENKALESITST